MNDTALLSCLMLLGSLFLNGCVIRLDITGDDGQSGQDTGVTLPPPKVPGGGETPSEPETPLTDAEQARQDEVDNYIRSVIYEGGTIVGSYVLPSGDVVDFVDRKTLPAVELPDLPFTGWFTVEDPLCYSRTEFGLGYSEFSLGGPGITHNNLACVWP